MIFVEFTFMVNKRSA